MVLASGICCSGPRALAQGGPLAVYTARIESGAVELRGFTATRELSVAEELRRSRWHSFGLRGLSPNAPSVADSVREIRGDLPRLQVRDDYQIVAFSGIDRRPLEREDENDRHRGHDDERDPTIRGGLAALGSWGARVFLRGSGRPYRPIPGGAFVSPDGRSLAIMMEGKRGEEVFLLGLGAFPTARKVELPRDVGRLEPGSLGLIEGALFVVARSGTRSVLCRAPVMRCGPLRARVVSDSFPMICPRMAYSPVAVAYIAGEESETDYQVDVFVAGAGGEPLNLTRSPGHYLENEPGVQRLAISPDGRTVAYSLKEYALEAETFLHSADAPGVEGRVHITTDELFAPYIEQEIIISFRFSDQLVFAAGHSDETDYFLVSGGNTFNLTGTGTLLTSASASLQATTGSSQARPPFQVGTLSPRRAVFTRSGLILIAAEGFDGQPGLVGVSAESGATVFKELGLSEVDDFFEFEGDTYFVVRTPENQFELFREHDATLECVGDSASPERPRLLLHGEERSFVAVPGRGLLLLETGQDPLLVARGRVDGAVALSRCDDRLVLSREGEYFVLDLHSRSETRLAGVPTFSGEIMAVRAAFRKGDTNGDDRVTLEDVRPLLKYLLFGAALDRPGAADTNDDGLVDFRDVEVIVRHSRGHRRWRERPPVWIGCED